MASVATDIGLIAQAVGKIADIVAEFLKTNIVRKKNKAIEYAERFILECDKEEPNKKRLAKYRKAFFKFN